MKALIRTAAVPRSGSLNAKLNLCLRGRPPPIILHS